MTMNSQSIAIAGGIPRWPTLCLLAVHVYFVSTPTNAFVLTTTRPKKSVQLSSTFRQCLRRIDLQQQPNNGRMTYNNIRDYHRYRYRRDCNHGCRSSSQLPVHAVAEAATAAAMSDYAPAAAALFNNMKLPAAVVTAGMISLGFATRFPELPRDSLDKVYPQELRQQCAKLDRFHIILGLIR